MTCYLIRHGKDDESLRGGWSNAPLAEEGIMQIQALAERLAVEPELSASRIFSSDLRRAAQTAEILAEKLRLPVIYLPQFREVNNGVLAGMKNAEAIEKYPGLYWNTLEWEQPYPDGESPLIFYERIFNAWQAFSAEVREAGEDVILVTHGGVINVILHIVNEIPYSNKTKSFSVKPAEVTNIAF